MLPGFRSRDIGTQGGGISYLVMEYLEGETLADRLDKSALPLEQFLKVGIEICEGLEKAHRSGVIHRVQFIRRHLLE